MQREEEEEGLQTLSPSGCFSGEDPLCRQIYRLSIVKFVSQAPIQPKEATTNTYTSTNTNNTRNNNNKTYTSTNTNNTHDNNTNLFLKLQWKEFVRTKEGLADRFEKRKLVFCTIWLEYRISYLEGLSSHFLFLIPRLKTLFSATIASLRQMSNIPP